MIDPGQLDRRVSLQSVSGTTDDLGETREAWAEYAAVWARLEPISGRELWLAQQAQSEATHKVTLRYRAGVTARDRVVYGGRTFHLTEPPREVGRREYLEFLVKEVP